jgi:hypothetical protein
MRDNLLQERPELFMQGDTVYVNVLSETSHECYWFECTV